MRFTEEGQRGTVRLTVAGVRRYGVRFTVAGVRSEVHRGRVREALLGSLWQESGVKFHRGWSRETLLGSLWQESGDTE